MSQKKYLSLIERKIKTLAFLNHDFSNLSFVTLYFFNSFLPSYLTFKLDFCFKNWRRSFKKGILLRVTQSAGLFNSRRALPYKPKRDVTFFRVSFFSVNS